MSTSSVVDFLDVDDLIACSEMSTTDPATIVNDLIGNHVDISKPESPPESEVPTIAKPSPSDIFEAVVKFQRFLDEAEPEWYDREKMLKHFTKPALHAHKSSFPKISLTQKSISSFFSA